MNTQLAPQAHPGVLDLFDRVPAPPPDCAAGPREAVTESGPTPEINAPNHDWASSPNEPNDLWWEPYADWRPPCFGRLALEYAARFGLSVMPLLVRSSAPVFSAVPRGPASASHDPAVVHAWWARAPYANVGIVCGPSGLVVLEVDPEGGGPETLAMHAERLGPLPSTWTARMVDGRKQYFFSHADPDAAALPQLHRLGPGVQVEHRGYVVAPPSLIWERHGAWLLDARPGRAPLAAMPSAWMDRLTGRQLPPNGLSGLDARHSIVGRAFETLGWLGRMLDDGRRIARCPWAREHTWPGGAGSDTATVVYSPECDPWFGEFACQHPECAERDATHLFEVLPREVLDAAYDALSVDMRPHTFAWDDELDLLIKPSAHALEAARELIGESGLAPAEVPNVGPDAEPPVCH